ncbi:MAG: hypothetical protein OMM_01297 [Candidatus Magnetoglobus multicellularis str. Araruama]|uniref:LamG-like jellyroll fold domain-containing protein n=1 Tax=Candidatus Magnetoglobus multicellularis str. Araruama TaxID=890399 RepID=A0A1V1PDK3_9BACT|nr:MAG: hypothetical protein OMM_01297 [Candidatus Magnetoglobus multicellularis str. Araruama]
MIKKIFISLTLLTFLFSSVHAELNKGLVAHYPFNGNVRDESANSNDGVIHGATLSSDRFNNKNSAYRFDGNDYISVSTNHTNLPLDDFTVSVWCKLIKHNDWDVIIEKVDKNGMNDFLIGFIQKKLVIEFEDDDVWEGGDSDNIIIDDFNNYIDKWFHFVYSYTDNNVNFYINGKLVKKHTTNKDYSNDDGVIIIGADIDASYPTVTADYFDGSIDDIRIYNRALSINEIQNLFIENQCNINDSDNDGVIDLWDQCPDTVLNSYVNRNGCPANDNSVVSGRISIKGQPLTHGNATLFQSGEIFQKSDIDENGNFKFDRIAEDKPINIMIRKPIE